MTTRYPSDAFEVPRLAGRLFADYPGRWGIAGGWAIDLYLNEVTRRHHDIEIAVLRRDQPLLQAHLSGWRVEIAIPGPAGGMRAWQAGEMLRLPEHELHTRPPDTEHDELEILLNEAADGDWVYRRDQRIRLPLTQAFVATRGGLPCLAPEIVLLFKAKHARTRDELDFAAAASRLSNAQRQWLSGALELSAPEHPWLKALTTVR